MGNPTNTVAAGPSAPPPPPFLSLCDGTSAAKKYDQSNKYYPTNGKCKPWTKCANDWIHDHLRIFIAVMSGVLFFEMCMVVGTFKLSQSMNTKGEKWYTPSEALDEGASG